MKFNLIVLAFALCACVSGEYGAQPPQEPQEPEARLGWIYVAGQGSNDPKLEKMDEIRSVRTYVFNDVADAARLEYKNYQETGAERQIKFHGVIGVNYNPSGSNNRKLLVFIVNEPPLMAPQFEAVENLRQLEALQLQMGDFLADQHLGVDENKYMPMTGVLCTDKIYANFEDADNHKQTVFLNRAVAKIEVWLTTDVAGGLTLGEGSFVKLQNTLDTSPLLYHEGGWRDVGSIQNPAAGYTFKTWSIPVSAPGGWGGGGPPTSGTSGPGNVGSGTQMPPNKPVHVCTFFAPERRVGTHPLKFDIGVVSSAGTRTGTAEIKKFKDGTIITEIRRNIIYKVTLNVKSTEITSEVEPWHDEPIETEL